MQKYSAILALLFTLRFLNAQTGRISGTILDSKTGETLPGALVAVEGTLKGIQADFDGKFSINNIPAGKITLVISFVSYNTKKITGVNVVANDATDVNVQLDPSSSQDLTEVEVVVTLNKENNTALVLQQKNSASVSDGISAETIKRTPDKNTSDVLKRVSGASIQDNKFVVVRGLNERYNAAFLNGGPLPSSETDRKAFAFDIFPSNMLDNLVITKTARPDLSGEFAGGLVDISTKNIPEKNFVSVSAQVGYNPIATGKTRVYYQGGKTDWLGVDDGTRAMPSQIPAIEDFPPAKEKNKQAQLAKDVPASDWGTHTKTFGPNLSFQAATGYNFKRKEKDFFGVMASVSYNKTNLINEARRNTYSENTNTNIPSRHDAAFTDKMYITQTLSGALLNLSCKINPNHAISLKNLYSINSDDQTTIRTGSVGLDQTTISLARANTFWFTGSRILSSQLSGDHYFEKSKIKINWLGSYSGVKREVPSLRRNIFGRNNDATDTSYALTTSPTSVGNDYGGFMFWSNLNENIKSYKADVLRGFKVSPKFNVELKAGGLAQERRRNFMARQFGYTQYQPKNGFFDDSLLYLGPSQVFLQQNMGLLPSGKGGFKLTEGTKPTDSYTASANLYAAYLMADVRFNEYVRLVAGARFESYNQKLIYPGERYIADGKLITKDTTVNDILPSANIIFSINDKQNIRLSFSQTVNRPEFRELAKFGFYDYNALLFITGNDELKRAKITNYDLRYEIFPGRGQLFSVSGFYKDFTNPIEQVAPGNANEISYANAPKAYCYGSELEYRIIIGHFFKNDSSSWGGILNNLTLFSNLALIKSEVDISKVFGRRPEDPTTRWLQGQSPYLFNVGLSYVDNDRGLSLSAIANRTGQRISVAGNFDTQPSIWEGGRTALDLQVSKSFLKNKLELRFTARDVLAKTQLQYFYNNNNDDTRYNKGTDDLVRSIQMRASFALQATYKF